MAAKSNCIICVKVIKDTEGKSKGQDSIYCEGSCQGWLPRTCAGIPKPVFLYLKTLSCACAARTLSRRKRLLISKAQSTNWEVWLTTSLRKRKKWVTQEPTVTPLNRSSFDEVVHLPCQQTTCLYPLFPLTQMMVNTTLIVVYGIQECVKGSSRHIRTPIWRHRCCSFSGWESWWFNSCTIHSRLGKYNEKRHRPILVKLSRTCEVSSILAGRKNLRGSPGFSIKPDMTKAKREIEATLLKKRWELIESGIERKDTRIKGNTKKIMC